MSDRTRRPSGGQRQPLPRRDPSEIEARLRHRDSGAIDARLRERERTAAAREKAILDARARQGDRGATHEVRGDTLRPRAHHPSRRRRAIVLATLLSGLLIAAVAVPPLAANLLRAMADNNPDLMRIGVVADAVGQVMDGRPNEPAGTDPTPVEFVVAPGTSSGEIINDLVAREIVTDRLAFSYVLATEGGLDELRAGRHVLNRTMSPRQVAAELRVVGSAPGTGIPIALRDGLRLEQIVAYLQTLPLGDLDIDRFYELASDPSPELRARFEWLRVVPEGRSVEGFLGSGIFDVEADVTAEEMLDVLLQRWQESPSHTVIADAEARGLNFYEVVTMASIVEREAALDQEKPLIAGVFQNRLDGVGEGRNLLQSDSALIYAKDTMQLRDRALVEWPSFVFWTFDGLPDPQSFETSADLTGYHTWHSKGLPPGPIASPSLSSIEAAMAPDTVGGYLYFLSKLDGSREHVFARTYAEHLENIDIYLRAASPDPSALPTAAPSELPTAAPASPDAAVPSPT